MDPNNSQDESNEPMVILKPAFYKQRRFMVITALVFILISAGIGVFFIYREFTIKTPPPQPPQLQVAEKQPIAPPKSLFGIIRAVDTSRNILTIQINSADKSKGGGFKSYLVSNDVLITQQVLGVKGEEMKQLSVPTEVLVLSSLKKKNGAEAYLVFDEKDEKVVQIQMYSKKN